MSFSSSICSEKCRTATAYVVGVIGSFLVIGVLAWLVVRSDATPVDAQRAAERKAFRAQVEAPNLELKSYGIVQGVPNAGGVYRLPVDRALEIAAKEWGTSSEGREKLLKRLEAANTKPSFE